MIDFSRRPETTIEDIRRVREVVRDWHDLTQIDPMRRIEIMARCDLTAMQVNDCIKIILWEDRVQQ